MELFESNKQGCCAVCGEKIREEAYNYKDNWVEEGRLYIPFVCENCGLHGEDIYMLNTTYIGTNGWKPIEE